MYTNTILKYHAKNSIAPATSKNNNILAVDIFIFLMEYNPA